MSGRAAAWLAWSLWALAAALVAFGLALMARNRAGLEFGGQTALALLFPIVGAVVAARRPRHPIGWLLLAQGLVFAAILAQLQYTQYALLTAPGALPGGRWAVWLGTWTWAPMLGLFCVLLLLFPDGRPPSPRWRAILWLTAGWMAVAVVSFALAPGAVNLVSLPGLRVDNPMGLAAAAAVLGPLKGVAGVFTIVPLLAALASLVVRFRRARGQERQQLKWLTYAAALAVGAYLASFLVAALEPGEAGRLLRELQPFAFALLPVAIGIAILRHQLYDIDLLINRTLVYGALTVALALIYWGLVASSQAGVRALTGTRSNLAIVASTLAIAALFQPLRRRLQATIDRRFYRRKYDAQRTLAAFSASLRNETDLARISADLLAVVEETVQPAHLSLWLREPESRR